VNEFEPESIADQDPNNPLVTWRKDQDWQPNIKVTNVESGEF
jgi:hypothetical protein